MMTSDRPTLLLASSVPDFLRAPLVASYDVVGPDSLPARAGDVRAVVATGGVTIGEDLIGRLPTLEIVSLMAVGYDGVAVDACRRRGIHVTNTPDVLTDDVADLAVALVLMTGRRLGEAERFLRAGRWTSGPMPLAHAIRGRVAGILGLGRIGTAIATRLEAFGMRIAYHGRQRQPVPWEYCPDVTHLAAASDFLVVACPGGPETRGLVDAGVLAALGAEGTLVNIARGSVVDEQALVAALESGTIRSAGLDVYADEPRVPAALIACERAVLLPHVASATEETRHAMARLVVDNLAAHFAGRPPLTPV
jgi:lactate dehydrogenase-like 2-hydroxyacid dehydrogenase